MPSYHPSMDEEHVDPNEFAANHLYVSEGDEFDVDRSEDLDLDVLDEDLQPDEVVLVQEALESLNPTRMTREDCELFYDPPIRSDAEIASANRRAWFTQRGRTCLYPDCADKVRYTKKIYYCERHQDSEVARYTNPSEFYETQRIHPRVHGLKSAREYRSLSQVELSEFSGIGYRRVKRFEQMKDAFGPTAAERRILAEVLGTTESELLRHPERGVV
jgi:hypothetical protein